MIDEVQRAPVLHLRFEGRSVDVPLRDLGLDDASGDGDVRRAVALYLEVPDARLGGYVIDRHQNGNLTVRPQAVFG